MFSQAKQAGASMIRVDLSLSSIFAQGSFHGHVYNSEHFEETDQYAQLSEQYGIKVLAVMYGTPSQVADCPEGVSSADAYHCPVSDLAAYAQMVGKTAARYKGSIDAFEIINEPDLPRYFYGSAVRYGELFGAASDAIHAANPGAQVSMGGFSDVSDSKWPDSVLASNPSLAAKSDFASVHLRGSAQGVARATERWRSYFLSKGIKGPLWLTEFGYPADAPHQYDSLFRFGESAQADYYQKTLPWILGAGAEKIFVTERDWGKGGFSEEGLLASPDPLPANPVVRQRQAFEVIRQASKDLKPVHPPAPKGSIVASEKKPSVKGSALKLWFKCPQAGDCPAQSFRLKITGGGYLLRLEEGIPAGASSAHRLWLTRTSRRMLNRSGYLRAELFSMSGDSLAKLNIKPNS